MEPAGSIIGSDMNDQKLEKKKLAAIRLTARRRRISLIRRRAAVFALSLATVFTALVIVANGSLAEFGVKDGGTGTQQNALPLQQTVPTRTYEEDDHRGQSYAVQPTTQPSGQFFSSQSSTPVQTSQS
jgi:hypothetical protein